MSFGPLAGRDGHRRGACCASFFPHPAVEEPTASSNTIPRRTPLFISSSRSLLVADWAFGSHRGLDMFQFCIAEAPLLRP